MLRNIGIRWGMDNGGNRELGFMIRDVADRFGNDIDLWQGIIADRFVNGYVERSQGGRLTGDWIVFGEHDGNRYYIDLATHEEGTSANASILLSKLRGSAEAEFPFLFT